MMELPLQRNNNTTGAVNGTVFSERNNNNSIGVGGLRSMTRSKTSSREVGVVVDENTVRRMLVSDWNQRTERLFLQVLRRHRQGLAELFSEAINRERHMEPPHPTTSEKFLYYERTNQRMEENCAVVQTKYQAERTAKQRSDIEDGTSSSLLRGFLLGTIWKPFCVRPVSTKLQKEISREILYLKADIYEFKQLYTRHQQRRQEELWNNHLLSDGKSVTATSQFLYEMTVKNRKKLYRTLFRQSNQNNAVTVVLDKDGKIEYQEGELMEKEKGGETTGTNEENINNDGNDSSIRSQRGNNVSIGSSVVECAICLEDITNKHDVVRSKNNNKNECKHMYCEECIVDYFSHKKRYLRVNPQEPVNPCPVCRSEFVTIPLINQLSSN